MRKKTIAILFGLGFGLALVAVLFYVGGLVSLFNNVSSCDYSSPGYYSSCPSSMPGSSIALLGVAGLTALAGGVLTTISWIAILIKQAQRQQWAWFVCTLLFSSICMLIWLIVEPEYPAAPQYAQVYQPRPAYPPDSPYYQDPYRPQ